MKMKFARDTATNERYIKVELDPDDLARIAMQFLEGRLPNMFDLNRVTEYVADGEGLTLLLKVSEAGLAEIMQNDPTANFDDQTGLGVLPKVTDKDLN
jgi:hypothetical protein